MIFFKGDYKDLDDELDRLASQPTRKTALLLDAVLEQGFKKTQAAVHIDTESLKGSGKKTSEVRGDKWEGQIEYGGSTPGPKNPVNYAIYEKARGGEHDFMLPLKGLGPQIAAAVLAGMRKSR